MKRAIAVLALLAALPVQGQQVYRWVDAQGEVHYSGTPPPGQQVTPEVLSVPKGSAAPAADGTAQGDQAEPSDIDKKKADYEKRKAEHEQANAANKARVDAERARACQTAREYIAELSNAPARRYRQPDGTYVHYDDATREARIADARAAEAENCD